MPNLTIGITWVPRGAEVMPMTSQTWTGADFIVYPDGHPLRYKVKADQQLLGNQVGCFKHYLRVLTDLVRNTDTPFIGIIPDDVNLAPDFARKCIEGASGAGVGYAAGYTPTGMSKITSKVKFGTGWVEIRGGWGKSYGGCYVYPRAVAERIIEHPYIRQHAETYKKNQQIDAAIPELMHRLGLKQLMHVPSLSDHIGTVSTIGHRHTGNEKGYKFG